MSLNCKHVNSTSGRHWRRHHAFGFPVKWAVWTLMSPVERDEEPPAENEDFVLNFEEMDKLPARDLQRITAWMESMLASLCQLGNVKVSVPPCLCLVACAVYQCCLRVLSTNVVYLCCLPMLSTNAVYVCCLPMLSVLSTCAVYLCCLSMSPTCAVYQCCLPVLFTNTVYLCCVPVLFICAVYQCCLPMLSTCAV